MKRDTNTTALIVAVALILSGASSKADELPSIDGLLGVESATNQGWLAVLIDTPEGLALSAIRWYNNDALLTFPAVYVGTGYSDGPGPIGEMEAVADSVTGTSDSWSDLMFDEPVAATQGALYVVFEFPPDCRFEERGEGGGPAIGYCEGTDGSRGWISGDGIGWLELSELYSFAFLPEYVPYEEGMTVKMFGEAPTLKQYTKIGPNPFNPEVNVEFGLPKGAHVRIDVFDIRGQRVARLADEHFAAGRHNVSWRGRDGYGRVVASGVYFARVELGSETTIRRITLVK